MYSPGSLLYRLEEDLNQDGLMEEKLTCPRVPERKQPPVEGEAMDEACLTCPALLKQVNERGEISYFCLAYRSRFASPGPVTPIATVQSKAKWSWERQAQVKPD
jgi:hypothetical protein